MPLGVDNLLLIGDLDKDFCNVLRRDEQSGWR